MGWNDSGDSSGTRDSWGGGSNTNDAANQRGYGGYGGRDGGSGAYGNLGLGSGPYSAFDPETGSFLGVVDDSKNTFEKWATNFQTNIAKKWSELSGFNKLGLGVSLLSSPTMALAGTVFLGLKSLAQALSTPGLTEEDKTNLTNAVENYNSLSENERAQIRSEAQSAAGLTGPDGQDNSLLNSNVKTNFGDGGNVGTYSYNPGSAQIFEDYVNTHYEKALGEYRNQADKINAATEKQTGLLDSLISGLSENNNLKPVKADVGSQTFSWIPKANRNTAEQIKTYGQQRLLNSVTDSLTGNANLNYLASLKDLAEIETKKSAADKGIAINERQLDQNEPGFLEYAKGISSLLGGPSSLKELFS